MFWNTENRKIHCNYGIEDTSKTSFPVNCFAVENYEMVLRDKLVQLNFGPN